MSGVWLGIAGLLVLVIIGAMLIHLVRKHFNPTNNLENEGFSLHDLRRMRAQGKLSDEEYNYLRGLLVGRARTEQMCDDDDDTADVRKHE